MELFGRQVIYSDVEEINSLNVLDVINAARVVHEKNRNQIDFLYRYYRGDQPILYRKKDVRPEICNRIVENRANEIVSFKVGYLCGEPIQYISRSGKSSVAKQIGKLNDMMLVESKASKDKDLIEWQMIAGTAYRMIAVSDSEDSPFELYTIDPRNAFVIHSSKVGNKVLAGVHVGTDAEKGTVYSVYTDRLYMEVTGIEEAVSATPHSLGFVPIIEYPANNARLGAFEPVIPILNAINTVASNRIDGVEQFVQSLMKFVNCEIDSETFARLQQQGAISIRSVDGQNADVEIMTQELNQQQTQTLIDYMYQSVLTIVGMPNRNGGSSTSDTGAASLLRDGWSTAEARAKDSELMFKRSEREMLKVVLRICRDLSDVNISLADIETKFTRRNYENIQTKAQVLCEMLNNPKIEPKLAFTHCGMFTDPEEAYQMSMKWFEEVQKKLEEQQKKVNAGGRDVPTDKQAEKP